MQREAIRFMDRIMDLENFPSNFPSAFGALATDIGSATIGFSIMGVARRNKILTRHFTDDSAAPSTLDDSETFEKIFTEAATIQDEVHVFGLSPENASEDLFGENINYKVGVDQKRGLDKFTKQFLIDHGNKPLSKSTLWCGYCNSAYGEVVIVSIGFKKKLNISTQALHDIMKNVLPVLHSASSIYRQHYKFRDEHDSISKVMDCIKFGVMVLNRDGKLQYHNRKARVMAEREDGIYIRSDGKVHFKTKGQQGSLVSILASLVAKGDDKEQKTTNEGIAITRQGNDTVYPACVSRLSMDHFGHKYRRAHYVIILGDPESNLDEDLDLQSLYGLSKAEASVLSGIVVGHTVDQIATIRQIKSSTVRTIMKNACRKLGVSRQQDIIRLVLTGPHGIFAGDNGYKQNTDLSASAS